MIDIIEKHIKVNMKKITNNKRGELFVISMGASHRTHLNEIREFYISNWLRIKFPEMDCGLYLDDARFYRKTLERFGRDLTKMFQKPKKS